MSAESANLLNAANGVVFEGSGGAKGTLYLRLASTTFAVLVFAIAFLSKRGPWPKNAPKQTYTSWPIVGTMRFFSGRWDFLRDAAGHSSSGQHSFAVGGYDIVGLSGEAGRRVFFESKQLSLPDGYAALLAASPSPPANGKKTDDDLPPGYTIDFSHYFHKRLARLFQHDRLTQSLPLITGDTYTAFKALAASNTDLTDPFDSVYRLVYQLTMRTVGCADIANSPALLKKTLSFYNMVENAVSSTAILFPRFPTFGFLQRTYGGGRIYMLLKGIVDGRAKTGVRVDDPLQFLIDEGDDMMQIIQFVMGALFAGLLNSGINACFVLAYLAASPDWLARVRTEVAAVAAKYDADPSRPLTARLDAVPLEAWESEFHTVDLCLRDSIRLQTVGAAFRRNMSGRDVPIGNTGQVIPPGAYATYPLYDIHMDPSVYPDPGKWDPARYTEPRNEDKKAPMTFVGWGAGRHPCLGMKFAKLEQNVIVAYWVAMFDFSLCDEKGRPTQVLPRSDRNGWTAGKPTPGCRLRFKVREGEA